MELTGLAPGPRVGEIRRRVSEWAQDNRVEDAGAQIEAEAVRLRGRQDGGQPRLAAELEGPEGERRPSQTRKGPPGRSRRALVSCTGATSSPPP